ncbi:50S ribosomal protein L21 [Buchananella hordeovulneris]|uniref:Large ribosomal subunit protein bL21 n=1 Tax=Buchananella hordeovulneris TaxID=52770 RepID=A0A1Q5PTK3_9ACTO|nr:50S ribosomal protein L21 [Buchananella hordeovulneris]MDO5081380.1 50S ribosomal protein L21 [Buchananella hordeovulneris]OKL50921.1 50S ribosomal protein L21 [Buchananella hordeovulneris]RRD44126.1 50S ribosomal protein L21 [Buchananella hordeovulneris]RRD51709.1 50S ribosomal protein L21 [Buchananella hordeovulneris]
MSRQVVYAIVKAGGRQEKVSVGDVVVVDKVEGEIGAAVELTPLMLVDGDKVTTEAAQLGKVKVTGEIVGERRGPKITILRYKNKTGYRRRQGHRSKLTAVKVTGIK